MVQTRNNIYGGIIRNWIW